jgi:glycosyltransferase involved in cell wall biosynthesis
MTGLFDYPLHQVLVTAAPGDAVTNAALQIRSALRERCPSELFACHIHPALAREVHPFVQYPAGLPPGSVAFTIVHISIGDPDFLSLVLELPGMFILSYHNLTPAEYFEAWSPETARLLELGRHTLQLLRDRTALAMADSGFNAADLVAAGYREVRVVGLVLDPEKLLRVPADPAVLAHAATFDGPRILTVGQLYPHKRSDLVLAAFHVLLTRYQPDAHLVLAGAARLHPYEVAVRQYIDRLGLGGRATVTGEIRSEELAAWYRSADLFVIASEHEGFCVPLVEAMWFDVPILARSNGAVPETLGDAGILVPGDTGPSALAYAMGAVLEDEDARAELQERGRRRREIFAVDPTRSRFLAALNELR